MCKSVSTPVHTGIHTNTSVALHSSRGGSDLWGGEQSLTFIYITCQIQFRSILGMACRYVQHAAGIGQIISNFPYSIWFCSTKEGPDHIVPNLPRSEVDGLYVPDLTSRIQFGSVLPGQILELHTNLTKDGKDIVFIWVPGHVGIRVNSAAVSLQLRMPLLVTPRLSSSLSQT